MSCESVKVQSWVAALATFTVVMWVGVLGKGILIRQTTHSVRIAHATIVRPDAGPKSPGSRDAHGPASRTPVRADRKL